MNFPFVNWIALHLSILDPNTASLQGRRKKFLWSALRTRCQRTRYTERMAGGGLYIDGILDFSLIGILSKLSAVLAASQVGIFAVSTYNTDYIFVKKDQYSQAVQALRQAGYAVE